MHYIEVKDLQLGNLLHDINFKAYGGEILGIGGLVGSGRTELVSCIYGSIKKYKGTITLDGKPVSRSALAAALMAQLDLLRTEALAQPTLWLAEYRRRCLTVGREVQILRDDAARSAVALDVDKGYGLRVRYENGEEATVRAGEVSVRGLYGYV